MNKLVPAFTAVVMAFGFAVSGCSSNAEEEAKDAAFGLVRQALGNESLTDDEVNNVLDRACHALKAGHDANIALEETLATLTAESNASESQWVVILGAAGGMKCPQYLD